MSEGKSSRVITQVNRLTEYQKNIIKYLIKSGRTVEEIRSDDQLRRIDGTPILKKTVQMWKKRFENEGHMEIRKSTGRPKMLNDDQEKELIDFVKKNGEMDYGEVKRKTQFKGHRRTLNHYTLRHNLGMHL